MKWIIIMAILILVLIIIFIIWSQRKPLSYNFEVVGKKGVIGVRHVTKWKPTHHIIVKCKTNSKIQSTLIIDEFDKWYLFDNLQEGIEYSIEISRKDLLGKIKYSPRVFKITASSDNKYIVLVGASIGLGWNLPEIKNRVLNFHSTVFLGYRDSGYCGFDKIQEIKQVMNELIKPDVLVIKECATYFPNEDNQLQHVKNWIELIREHNIIPILATIVPVTVDRSNQKNGQQEGLLKYNDMIHKIADEEGIVVFDMEKALRINDDNRYLNKEYDVGDGMHLNRNAYNVLDQVMAKLINQNF